MECCIFQIWKPYISLLCGILLLVINIAQIISINFVFYHSLHLYLLFID